METNNRTITTDVSSKPKSCSLQLILISARNCLNFSAKFFAFPKILEALLWNVFLYYRVMQPQFWNKDVNNSYNSSNISEQSPNSFARNIKTKNCLQTNASCWEAHWKIKRGIQNSENNKSQLLYLRRFCGILVETKKYEVFGNNGNSRGTI